MRESVWKLTPTEQAICELVDEGIPKAQIVELAGHRSAVNSALQKRKQLKESLEYMDHTGKPTTLKTAHGRKLDRFIR